jgi:hypothetical protein
MNPLMGVALAHPEEPPLPHLEGVCLQVDEDQEQPLLGRGQRTVRRGRVAAGGTRPPIEAPCGHMRLECRVKRRHQLLKLHYRETGQVEYLSGVGLDVGKPSRAHGSGLLSSEAHATTNRN